MAPHPTRASAALIALFSLACSHARPGIGARQGLEAVQVVASTSRPATRVDGDRGSAAGAAIGGGFIGAFAVPGVCLKMGIVGVFLCGAGAYAVGLPGVILIEGVATAIGAGIKGSKRSKELEPIRARFRTAEEAFLPVAEKVASAEALVRAARASAAVAASYRLIDAAPAAGERVGRLLLSLDRISLEADAGAANFSLRVEASGTLLDPWGKEVGAERIVTGGSTRWTRAALAAGAGAALRAELDEAIRRAGTLMVEELLLGADAASRAYGTDVCGLGPVDPATGRPIEELDGGRRIVVEDPNRRTLAWEEWRAVDERVLAADVTYELRVWRGPGDPADADPALEVGGLRAPRFVIPPDFAPGATHAWSVRAVVVSGGKRFTTTWSHLRGSGGRCVLAPPPSSQLFLVALRTPSPPAPPDPPPAPDPFDPGS